MVAPKLIEKRQESQQKIREGVNALADIVKVTLGPGGQPVLLNGPQGPFATKDGVTVARYIGLEDPLANMAVDILREASSKTASLAGDGTTTATVLAQALYLQGLELINNGVNVTAFQRELMRLAGAASDYIRAECSRPIRNAQDLCYVATISANGDAELGQLIGNTVDQVGRDGVVMVEEAPGAKTHLEFQKGFRFDQGLLNEVFITDAKRAVAEHDRPLIALFDEKLFNPNALEPFAQVAMQQNKALVIIAHDFEGQVMPVLMSNHSRSVVRLLPLRSPGHGEYRSQWLSDLAAVTGATVLGAQHGRPIASASLADLGTALSITTESRGTVLISDEADPNLGARVMARVQLLRQELERSGSDYLREMIQERLGRLTDGVAILKLGAATDVAMRELKDRVEDALFATRAAALEGIVAGGGTALLRAGEFLRTEFPDNPIARVMADACQEPCRQILTNAGVPRPDGIIEHILSNSGHFGYDVQRREHVNMITQGVVDPTRAVILELKHAASVASLLLSVGGMVTERASK